ncbi:MULTISPECIES: hypothetical protein [unclassified Blastococcus]
MSKHLLDETAEFKMPRIGRHAAPETGELEITQRLEPAAGPRPVHRPRPDEGIRER